MRKGREGRRKDRETGRNVKGREEGEMYVYQGGKVEGRLGRLKGEGREWTEKGERKAK